MNILKKIWLNIKLKYDPNPEYIAGSISFFVFLLILLIGIILYVLSNKIVDIPVANQILSLLSISTPKPGIITIAGLKLPFGLDHIGIIAFIFGLIPYTIFVYLDKRKHKKNEEGFANFLFEMSEMMRGGLDPIKSVIEISKVSLGPLTPPLKNAAFQMTIGYSFEKAMRSMGTKLKSKIISRYLDLLIHASRAGGDISYTIYELSEDMKMTIDLEREKESILKQYSAIFYLAVFILMFLVVVISTQMLPQILEVISVMPIGSPELLTINFGSGFLHFLIIVSFVGGLIIGQIIEGNIKHGLKHSIILMCISYIVCIIFVINPSTINYKVDLLNNESINAVPGGISKLELKIYTIEDKGKNLTIKTPLKNQDVSFSIDGPDNAIIQKTGKTDKEGVVKVNVVWGRKPGNYTISINVKSSETNFNVYVGENNKNKQLK